MEVMCLAKSNSKDRSCYCNLPIVPLLTLLFTTHQCKVNLDSHCLLVHGQVTIIFVVSVCLFVCAEFFSAVFDPIWIKLGNMLHVWV